MRGASQPPGRTRGAGGETKGSGPGGARALVSPADPAFVSLRSFGRDAAQCPAGWPAGGTGVGSTPLFCLGPRGRHLGELSPTGRGEGQGSRRHDSLGLRADVGVHERVIGSEPQFLHLKMEANSPCEESSRSCV